MITKNGMYIICDYPGCKRKLKNDVKTKLEALDWFTAHGSLVLCPDHIPDWLLEWQAKQAHDYDNIGKEE